MTIQEKVASIYSSPVEVQRLSNLLHSAYGIFLILIALAILAAFLFRENRKLQYAPAGIIFTMAVAFILSLTFHKGITNVPVLLQVMYLFPHAGVHIIMGIVNIIGSIIDVQYLRGKIKNSFAPLALPLTFLTLGFLLVMHPHSGVHDHVEMQFHAMLGMQLVFAGAFFMMLRLTDHSKLKKVFLIASLAFMLWASSGLIGYHEQPTAYTYAFPPIVDSDDTSQLYSGNLAYFYVYKDFVVPQSVKITTGGTVKFVLMDDSHHDIASGPHPTHTDYPPLNIGMLFMNDIQSVTFPKAGKYGFHDHLNEYEQKLQGKILVEDP